LSSDYMDSACFSKASEREGDRSGEGLGCMRRRVGWRGRRRHEEESGVEMKEA